VPAEASSSGTLGWRVVRELFEPVVVVADAGEREKLFAGAARLAESVLGDSAGQSAASRADSVAAALQGLYWLTAQLAEQEPLLVAVDDAQWADIPSMRFLAHIAARLEGLPILLALTARPVERAADGERLSALTERTLLSVVSGLAFEAEPRPPERGRRDKAGWDRARGAG